MRRTEPEGSADQQLGASRRWSVGAERECQRARRRVPGLGREVHRVAKQVPGAADRVRMPQVRVHRQQADRVRLELAKRHQAGWRPRYSPVH